MQWYEIGAWLMVLIAAAPFVYILITVFRIAWDLVTTKKDEAWDQVFRDIEEFEDDVHDIPLDVARMQVLEALQAQKTFQVVQAGGEKPAIVGHMGPLLRELFERYSEISSDQSHFEWSLFEKCPWAPPHIYLSQIDEHMHLMTLAGKDEVYRIVDDEPYIEGSSRADFPSIYHWMLTVLKEEELIETYEVAKKRNELPLN